MTLDPEFRQQVEQRLLPKRGRPKTVFTPIYLKLAQPTGEQVRELRLRMSWALEFTATAVGLTDAQAVSDIECSADRRGTPRKLSRWRSAGR